VAVKRVADGYGTDWLLDADASIRWQVLDDLTDAPESEVAAERARVATEGWGARLLAEQAPDGRWGNGLYSPKWVSTTYTLLLLHWLGLPGGHPQVLTGCERLWDGAFHEAGNLDFTGPRGKGETCITGLLVLLASSFGYDDERVDRSVEWLLGQQLDDGGWNCASLREDGIIKGSKHGSFNTAINALDALLAYQRSGGKIDVAGALAGGQEFFLDHRLYKSHRTGEVVRPSYTRYPFPPQWHHDVLRGLEHFRAAGADRDERLRDGIDLVRRGQRPDGSWHRHAPYPGRSWFTMEGPGPSRWSTFRARRILQWWDS